MKKRYITTNVAVLAILSVSAIPATAMASVTTYTHPGTAITNLPSSPVTSANHTDYTHPDVVISNAPRQPLTPNSSLAPNAKGVLNYGWSASNWSGYAVTGSTYNDITGDWVVPTVSATSKSTYSSTWIGIDGFNNSDLIQTGTEQDYVNGKAQYDAWWEILPAAETVITTMAVYPGDHMTAHIHNNGNGTWTITLNDTTRNETFSTTKSYSGPGTSAEWIQEAPEINGKIATLAHYGETTFDPDTVNGVNPGLTSSESGYMVQNNVTVSVPSNPDSDTDGFNVEYGSTQPAPPQS
ncbi:G1 family glutamic endopeptidase [Alicyclobacillus fastidiosus]|uniref:G1 family endopeptidase n=1 Tax=Alicyclobacillus fastidiosus TaxID=392011 RepID=A0ABV5A9K2_9BACL|nr:G1 family glutamic endopeptidase [Alicyclobacillus fastidiosus]WEH10882.1 G1 family endopeptidase [Alicyclobacillus fastidiosus]